MGKLTMQAHRWLSAGTSRSVVLRSSAKQLLGFLHWNYKLAFKYLNKYTICHASTLASSPATHGQPDWTDRPPSVVPEHESAQLNPGISGTDPDVGQGPSPSSHRGSDLAALPAGLYVVPTPIGNLQDITLRAVDTLRGVSLLLAEDTRHTRKLLNYLGIRNLELLSCHVHNEKQRLSRVIQRLQLGEPIGLVSDAGMPGISDPGHAVVAAAVAAGVRVVVLPGPCAFVTALVGSGLPTDTFTFVGFLPPKSGARRKALESQATQPGTLVMYAPPHGLAAVLRDCVEVLGASRQCCVAREISKVHEEYFRSTLEGALREFGEVREARGEICLMVEGFGAADGAASAAAGGGGALGARDAAASLERVLRELLEGGMPVSAAVKEVVANLGANKKAVYALALRLSDQIAASKDTGSEPH